MHQPQSVLRHLTVNHKNHWIKLLDKLPGALELHPLLHPLQYIFCTNLVHLFQDHMTSIMYHMTSSQFETGFCAGKRLQKVVTFDDKGNRCNQWR